MHVQRNALIQGHSFIPLSYEIPKQWFNLAFSEAVQL